MKKLIALVGILIIGFVAWGKMRPHDPYAVANPHPNHTHTDFAIWMDGERMDFSDPDLMSGTSSDETTHDEAEERHDPYLHLHDEIGHVIHRHKPGLTIGDFFGSIQIGISGECYASFAPLEDGELCGDNPFRMFVNGEEMPVTMEYVYEDLDQILFTNADTEEEVQKELQQMTDDACLYSQRCPWRGEPPAENCIADPAIPCTE